MNFMSSGWACAQRRPLRSLAHILTLLNPMTIILLDDDTYLNYDLLIKKYGGYLSSTMMLRPLVVGELGGMYMYMNIYICIYMYLYLYTYACISIY
jgi:hypothetical protein